MSSDVIRVEGGELRRITVQPGDLFVLHLERSPSDEDVAELHRQWRKAVGDRAPLVVLSGGDLTVYRPVAPEAQQ